MSSEGRYYGKYRGVVLNNIFYKVTSNACSPTVGNAVGNGNIAFNPGYTGSWNGHPVWGKERTTWVKFVAPVGGAATPAAASDAPKAESAPADPTARGYRPPTSSARSSSSR